MATTPYFVFSPNTVLSVLGLVRGPDKTVPTPAEDWRTARVDVVIPALNEAPHIALCLTSVLRQTLRPRRIMLVDDGSTDATVEVAESFCRFHNVDLTIVKRRAPIGDSTWATPSSCLAFPLRSPLPSSVCCAANRCPARK